MTHYEILLSLNSASPPITNFDTCYPNTFYLDYRPPCGYTGFPLKSCPQRYSDATPEVKNELALEFTRIHPEFILTTDAIIDRLEKLVCRYSQLDCISSSCDKQKLFLLLAHDITLDGSEYTQNVATSAHVGDTSISYDSSYSSLLAKSPFFLWLSRTKPGNDLLIMLNNKRRIICA